mgnify:FL=1
MLAQHSISLLYPHNRESQQRISAMGRTDSKIPVGMSADQIALHKEEMKAKHKPYKMVVQGDLAKKISGGGTYGSTTVGKPSSVVKVIPIIGPLSKYSYIDWWNMVYVEGTQSLIEEIAEAQNESDTKAIVLYIDSPGGDVDGTFELAEVIRKSPIPIYACVSGTCASAAYWIASQCTQIFVTAPEAEVGSIGVYIMHLDKSVMYEELMGIKITYVTSTDSPDKVVAPSNAPLSDEDRAKLVAMIDPVKTNFIAAVKKGRGDKLATDQPQIFQGGVFMAKDAKAWGLIDGVKTFDDIVIEAQREGGRVARQSKKSNSINNSKNMGFLEAIGLKAAKTEFTEDQTLTTAEANVLAESVANLQKENGKLSEQTVALSAEVGQLKATIAGLETEKSAALTAKEEAENARKEAEEKLATADTATLQASIDDLTAQLEAKSTEMAGTQTEREAAIAAKAETETKLTALQANYDSLVAGAKGRTAKPLAAVGDPATQGRTLTTAKP